MDEFSRRIRDPRTEAAGLPTCQALVRVPDSPALLSNTRCSDLNAARLLCTLASARVGLLAIIKAKVDASLRTNIPLVFCEVDLAPRGGQA
jgi:hypothetical protein